MRLPAPGAHITALANTTRMRNALAETGSGDLVEARLMMPQSRTSANDPLRVDFLPREGLGLPGRIGLTSAPGRRGWSSEGFMWDRDLGADLARLRDAFGAGLLVSLLHPHERMDMGITDLAERAAACGLEFLGYPIRDGCVPVDMDSFHALVERILRAARAGTVVVVHCRAGLGRSGMVAAACLVALGLSPEVAVRVVRAARSEDAISREQEQFVAEFARGVSERPKRLP